MIMIALVLTVILLAAIWGVVLFVPMPVPPSVTVPIAILVTVAPLVALAVVFAWRRWKARRAAAEIEKALQAQAEVHGQGARPDQQAEVEAMKAEFEKAVQALKSSKLARGGRDALAVLPWYMIIGPPGAGKSTALRASGLKFPYLSKRGGVRGIGGTRNCEWWLTNDAVLLDTAGRYATEDEDHDEWMSFLDTVARARPRKPLNGLLVAVPLVDVAAESEEGAAELGQRMRERVDEVMSRLQVVLPVYVLLTKCDLLPGFVETFGDLRKADRGQVWGFTLPLGETGERREAVLERFDELLGALEERTQRRLGEERQVAARERIFEFPQQVEAARLPLAAFVDALFTQNVYQDTPILRGVYFTSGTQEGRVVDRVMASMAQAFGIRPVIAEAEPVLEAKSYFLHDLFAKVLFPDQTVAFRNARAVKRDALWRWGAVAGALAVVAAFAIFPGRSFLKNKELVDSTGQIVDSVTAKLASAGKGAPPVADLEPLRERMALLVDHAEKGPPLSMRWGFYRGNELLPAVQKLYGGAVRRLLIDPVFRRDAEELDSFVRGMEASQGVPGQAEYGRYYDKLRLHLLLSSTRRDGTEKAIDGAEQEWIGRQVAAASASRVGMAQATTVAYQDNAQLFARLLAGDPALAMLRRDDLVKRARDVLRRVPMATLALERLVGEGETRNYDLTLAAALRSPVPALGSSFTVRGAFTKAGYESVMKERLASPASLIEVWVVSPEGKDGEARLAEEMEKVRSLYFEKYIAEWKRFVDSIEVRRGAVDTRVLLDDLTGGTPPPFGRILQEVRENTRIDATGEIAAKGKELLGEKLQKWADGRGPVAQAALAQAQDRTAAVRRLGPQDVWRAFAGLVAFGFPPEPPRAGGSGGAGAEPTAPTPLKLYQEQLDAIRMELQATSDGGEPAKLVSRVEQARQKVRLLIGNAEVGWRPRLESWLWPPIEAATASGAAEATREASSKWCASVAGPFRARIGDRYPFQPAQTDAALADVGEFFRRGSGALESFVTENLRGQVQRVGDGYQFNRQVGGKVAYGGDLLAFLNRGWGVTQALFVGGAAEPSVPFRVRIKGAPNVHRVILQVDGDAYTYENQPEEWHHFTWTGKGRSFLKFQNGSREDLLEPEGEWAFFRLLEMGRVVGDPSHSLFAISFPARSLGTSVTIEFQPKRSQNPFFPERKGARSRLFDPLRAGPPVPLAIGKGGGPCR